MHRMSAVVVGLVIALSMTTAWTQMPQRGGAGVPVWNPSTVQTFSGTVVAEKEIGRRADTYAVLVKTAADQRRVVLGPKQALDPALTSLTPNTPIEVTASKVMNGRLYLASSVKVAGKVYKLRDDQGHMLGTDGKPLQPQPQPSATKPPSTTTSPSTTQPSTTPPKQ
jgi:hypothetical protein